MKEMKKYLDEIYRIDPDEKSRDGFLCLDMNENVSGLPSNFIKNILSQISPDDISRYPSYKSIREKIASVNELKSENICLCNGSDAAIKYIFDALISDGDHVLLTDPTFAMYPIYSQVHNARTISLGYLPNLSFPFEDFKRKLKENFKMAVIVNPNNPTGSAIDPKELLEIVQIAHQNKTIILVDEAYFYYYPQTIIKEVIHFDNLIVLRTFSKLCGLASLRLGYAAASREIIERIRLVRPTFDVNVFAIKFAEELLDSKHIIAELLNNVNEGQKYLIERLSVEGIEYRKGAANFLLINCEGKADLVKQNLEKQGILVGGDFQQPFLKDFIRVTLGPKSTMEIFCEKFIKIWKSTVALSLSH